MTLRQSTPRHEQATLLRSGDEVLIYEEKNEGYVYSELFGCHYNSVCLFPVAPPYCKRDPKIPDVNCATFVVYLESDKDLRKPIQFGQKIKLKHIASGRYLKPDKTKASWSGELGRIMVELQDDGTSEDKGNFLFKILPQHGIRTRATHVSFNQPLRFESTTISGHYLHCSDNTYDQNFPVYADRHELNLSTLASEFMIIPHFQPHSSTHVGLQLRAGQLLQLRETKESYSLVANGSYIEIPTEDEKVYLKEQYTEVGGSWFPPTLWQLEDEQQPLRGDTLLLSLTYRIKHVLTRKYLAVVRCESSGSMEEYKVVVKDCNLCEQGGVDTLFSLILPSQQDNQSAHDVISDGEHLLLKHTHTGLWLNVRHDNTIAKERDPGVQLDSDAIKTVSLSNHAKDAIALSGIPQKLLVQLYSVTGISQVLSFSAVRGHCDQGVVKELLGMYDVGNNRPFLHHLQVVDMLIKLIHQNVENIDTEEFHQRAFQVLVKYAATDDINEKRYLAPHFPFFLSQFSRGLNAEEVVLSMVKNNLRLVSTMGETLVEDILKHSAVSKQLLVLLGYLSVNSEVPIPSNQTYILNNFIKSTEGKSKLYKTTLKGGQLCIQTPELSDFVVWDSCTTQTIMFLESQLLLFAMLCEGNHRESILYFRKDQGEDGYVSFEEALAFSSNTDLPEAIQAVFIRLIRVMFIEGHEACRNVFKSPSWCIDTTTLVPHQQKDQVQAVDPAVAINGELDECVALLKSLILQCLQSQQYTREQFRNLKVSEILKMTYTLVNFGFYHALEEIKLLFQALIHLLHSSESTKVQHKVEDLLALLFHVQLRAAIEEKVCTYVRQHQGQRQRTTTTKESISDLSVLDGIKFAAAPHRVLLPYFYWMSLQKMQPDIQLLSVEQSLQEEKEIWKSYPTLQHHLSSTISKEDSGKAADILHGFSKRCIVSGLPHKRNQEIYSTFALEDVLNFMINSNFAHLQRTPGTYSEEYKVLLDACFHFLKGLAYKRIDVQKQLFTYLDKFLESRCALLSMAELLIEIFAGGSLDDITTEAHFHHLQSVHLQVSENNLKTIIELIQGGDGRHLFMLALQLIAKYDDLGLVLSRNVEIIMKHFLDAGSLLASSPEKKRRNKALLKMNPKDHTSYSLEQLTFLLDITSLLACCAEGGHPSVDTKCRALYSPHELLSIVMDSEISYAHKTPFLHFLVSVYMDCGDVDSMKLDLERLWGCLESTITALNDAKSAVGRETKECVQAVMLSTANQLPNCSGEDVSTFDNAELRGIILYALKGVLPLLKEFYQKFAFHPLVIEKLKEKAQLSVEICTALWDFSGVLMKIPLLRYHRNVVTVTVMTVTNSLFNAQILNHSVLPPETMRRLCSPDPVTHPGGKTVILSLKGYGKVYSMEEDLNEGFKRCLKEELSQSRGPLKRVKHAALGPEFTDLIDLFRSRKIDIQTVGGVLTERLLNEAPLKEWRSKPQLCNIAVKCLQTVRAHAEQLKKDDSSGKNLRQFCEDLDTEFIVQVVNLASFTDVQELSKEALLLLVSIIESHDSPIVTWLTKGVQNNSGACTHSAEKRSEFQKLQQALHHFVRSIHSAIQTAIAVSSTRVDAWKEVCLRKMEDTDIKSTFDHYSSVSEVTQPGNGRKVLGSDAPTDEISSIFPMRGLKPRKEHTEEADSERIVLTTWEEQCDISDVVIWMGGEDITSAESIPMVPLSSADLDVVHKKQQPKIDFSPWDQGLQTLIPSIDNIKLILEVLALMCGWQNLTLQNYMQQQPGQIESVNIVEDVQQLLQHFEKVHTDPESEEALKLSIEDMKVLQLILQALIVLCVANSENQSVLVCGKIEESIQWILSVSITSVGGAEHPTELLKLKSTASILVDVLTEELEDDSKELLYGHELQSTFPDTLRNFHAVLLSQSVSPTGLWQMIQGKKYELSSDIAQQSLIRVYHSGLGRVWKAEGEKEEALNFCENNSRSIEVQYGSKEGKKILTTITFPYDPADELSEPLKESVKAQVDRNNPDDKLVDFLDWMNAAKRDIQWQRRMRYSVIARIITLFSTMRHYLLLILTFLLNFILLITFKVPESEIPPEDKEELPYENNTLVITPETVAWFAPDNPEGTIFYILAISHLALSTWMVLEYYARQWPHFIVHGVTGAVLPKFVWRAMYHLVKSFAKKRLKFVRTWLEENQEEEKFEVNLYQLDSLYRLIFLAASITSLLWYGYFYPICTFYVVLKSDVLREVLNSVTKHGKNILLVGALAILVLYTYSVISFAMIHEAFFLEDTPTLFCKTMWECFISVSHIGLLFGLGEIPLVSGDFRELAYRTIYDVSFFIIVTTIGLNVILGIIVDTFSELRQERLLALQDSRDFCFICNIPSHEFDRREANGFQWHIEHDHGMWNYIYYYVYLDSLDPRDHTAIQSYVYRMIQSQQTSFFPLYMAKCLGGVYSSSHLEQKVDELGQGCQTLTATVERNFEEFGEAIGMFGKGQQRASQYLSTSYQPSPSRQGSSLQRGSPSHHGSQLPHGSQAGAMPSHAGPHESLALIPPTVFIVDDQEDGSKGGSLDRGDADKDEQMKLLSKKVDNINDTLAAILKKLKMAVGEPPDPEF